MSEDSPPTPAEILAGCKRIQDSWDRQTERSRRTGSAEFVPYELPEATPVDMIDEPDVAW